MQGQVAMCEPWARGAGERRARVSRAASAYALQRTDFNRAVLARAMRLAMAAGIARDEVTALSVLPREEVERLIAR